MPNRKISEDIQYRAVELLTLGWNVDDVAAALGVSRRSVGRWWTRYHKNGGEIPRYPSLLCGRPQRLTPELMEELRNLVIQAPSLYIDEIVTWFAHHHGLFVSVSTIHRALERLGLSLKRLRRTASQRNEVFREQWWRDITSRFTAEQLVFADESSKDNRTVLRRFGRAPLGQRAVEVVSADRGVRYSILPALSLHGLLTVRVVRGSVDGLEFFDWVVFDLLPKMNPFPGPNSVLIVDNCRTHKSQAVRDAVEAAGCLYIFLPAYSPDLNPIEEAFSCVKHHLRRHSEQYMHSLTPEADLVHACLAAVTPEKARGWYRHSGYL